MKSIFQFLWKKQQMDINVAFLSLLNCVRSSILNNYDDILLLRNNHCLLRQRRLLDVTYFKMSVEGGLYAKTSICFRGRVSLMCAFPSVPLDVIFCAWPYHVLLWLFRGRSYIYIESQTFFLFCFFPEPINITMHPKSQTEKEGARVEFKCKVDKKKENVIYQWRKDGVAIPGKNDSTLVLDVVELRDFGSYTCYVKYQDSFNEGKESICATLDVIPQSRNGMSEWTEVYVSKWEGNWDELTFAMDSGSASQ